MTWNADVPALANQISADVPDIEENLACLGPYPKIWVPAGAMLPRVTNGAEAAQEEYSTNDVMVEYLLFSGTTKEYATFNLTMPLNWDAGTIKAKFYWDAATGASASDGVVWGIQGVSLTNDDAIDAATGTAKERGDTVIAVGDLHISSATDAVTIGGGPAAGHMVHFVVHRDPDNGSDTMAEDAKLIGVLIQYTIDTAIETSW